MTHTRHQGFTYIELLIVVGLIGIILSLGIVMDIGSLSRSSVIEERDLFVSLILTGARAHAIANIHESAHGVHIDNTLHQYILFEGTAFSQGNPSNRAIKFTSDHISVTTTGGDDIIFTQLSGDVLLGDGTVTFEGNNATQYVRINKVGQIDW